MGLYIQRTTLKQCENLTIDLLKEKLEISETEIKSTLDYLITEDVVVKKYIFQCNKCGGMNTFTDDLITGEDVCQICEGSIDVKSYIEGAEIRYILDRTNFMELLEEKNIVLPKKTVNEKPKIRKVPFEVLDSTDKKEKRGENMAKENKSLLFISHSSEDVAYIECFVRFLEALGFDDSNMFCSSIDEYGMKWGSKIYDFLAEKFNNKDNELMVLFMLSENYYDSPACLNEMGATWVLKKTYRSILLPGFEFKDIDGAVDPREIAIKLDDEKLSSKLNDVKEQLSEMFDLKEISSKKWDRIRDELIDGINKAKSSAK